MSIHVCYEDTKGNSHSATKNIHFVTKKIKKKKILKRYLNQAHCYKKEKKKKDNSQPIMIQTEVPQLQITKLYITSKWDLNQRLLALYKHSFVQ